MCEAKIEKSIRILPNRWMWCTKLAAVVLSLLFASPNLPILGEPTLNFVSATFYIALVGLIPRFGWTTPSLILGFWLTPMLFAFRVNGSFAEDLTTAITGGIIGLLIGLMLDIQKHHTDSTNVNLGPNASLPDGPNAG